MSDEPSTLLGAGESLNKGQAVDLLLNTNAPEEASEDTQEPVAEVEEVVETDEIEATFKAPEAATIRKIANTCGKPQTTSLFMPVNQ